MDWIGCCVNIEEQFLQTLFEEFLVRPSSICRNVFATSAGVVNVAAIAPAKAPQANVA